MNNKEYRVLRPIGFGGRQEKGTILSLSDADAQSLPADALQLLSQEAPAPEVEDLSQTPIANLKLAELKDLASKLGLDTSGTKADLSERITLSRVK